MFFLMTYVALVMTICMRHQAFAGKGLHGAVVELFFGSVFPESFLSVIQLMTLDRWADIISSVVTEASNAPMPSIVVSVVFIFNFLMLSNVFVSSMVFLVSQVTAKVECEDNIRELRKKKFLTSEFEMSLGGAPLTQHEMVKKCKRKIPRDYLTKVAGMTLDQVPTVFQWFYALKPLTSRKHKAPTLTPREFNIGVQSLGRNVTRLEFFRAANALVDNHKELQECHRRAISVQTSIMTLRTGLDEINRDMDEVVSGVRFMVSMNDQVHMFQSSRRRVN